MSEFVAPGQYRYRFSGMDSTGEMHVDQHELYFISRTDLVKRKQELTDRYLKRKYTSINITFKFIPSNEDEFDHNPRC